jgi:hypothetical protein
MSPVGFIASAAAEAAPVIGKKILETGLNNAVQSRIESHLVERAVSAQSSQTSRELTRRAFQAYGQFSDVGTTLEMNTFLQKAARAPFSPSKQSAIPAPPGKPISPHTRKAIGRSPAQQNRNPLAASPQISKQKAASPRNPFSARKRQLLQIPNHGMEHVRTLFQPPR